MYHCDNNGAENHYLSLFTPAPYDSLPLQVENIPPCAGRFGSPIIISPPRRSVRIVAADRRMSRDTTCRSTRAFNRSFQARLSLSSQGGLVDPRMRASNEALPRARVPRAGGRPGRPSFPFGNGRKFLSQCRLLQSFLIEIQAPGNSFPRSLSQPHKSLLHINRFHSPLLSGYPAGPGIALLQGITHIERSRPCRT